MNAAQQAKAEQAQRSEDERQAACLRRKLPITTSIEDILAYEYRRGMQVRILLGDSNELKALARRIEARHENGETA